MKIYKIPLALLVIFVMFSCALAGQNAINVSSAIQQMTLREKVGQLFIVRPDAIAPYLSSETVRDTNSGGVKKVSEKMKAFYEEYPAGGFALFRKNIESPKQITQFTEQLHALGNFLPLLCIDEEGGMVARIANHGAFDVESFPDMLEIANGKDVDAAYDLGLTIGAYLNKYGLDVDFAPVADVNTNPENPVIGKRALGDDPELAAKMVCAVLDGLNESGVVGCLKHFPGHGDTMTDTHFGYAETRKTWEEMLACEMITFEAGMENGARMIMTAHIAAPNVTGNDVPSSLSFMILSEKLRDELGYEGVIITDAMEMGAITDQYDSGEAAVLAIKAGADIVLMPFDYQEAFEAVVHAVETGEISEERINESVERVLKLKTDINASGE